MLDEAVEIVFVLIKCGLMDILCYYVTDMVTKSFLRDVNSDPAKRLIWLYEVLALGLFSVVIYWRHHMPYLLAFLTSATFVTTQFFNQTNIAQWWISMKSWWEEHMQMKESMYSHMYQIKPQQLDMPLNQNHLRPLQSAYAVNYRQGYNCYDHMNLNASHIKKPSPDYSLLLPNVNNHGKIPASNRVVSDKFSSHSLNQDSHGTPNPKQSADRQKLHATAQGARNSKIGKISHANRRGKSGLPSASSSTLQTLKSRFASAFGGNAHARAPLGFRNGGRNVCFLNAALQCVARTPGLSARLMAELSNDASCSEAESELLCLFAELLEACRAGAAAADNGCLDSSAFRRSAACFRGSPVAPPSRVQTQQDAAEFLMWILTTVHQILVKTSRDKERVQRDAASIYASDQLVHLENIYGELHADRVAELIAACHREIGVSKTLSSTDAVQRLADLEWLAHRRANSTPIDSAFCGQLLEVFHCLADDHISVTTQPFNVLSLPVFRPYEVSRLARLEDCFEKFCETETLIGANGLQCAVCSSHGGYARTPRTRLRHSTLDSAVNLSDVGGSFSPIVSDAALGDSGYYDNRYRTSTPIVADQSRRTPARPSRAARDAERRCILYIVPDSLVVQLGRFQSGASHAEMRKNHVAVQVPLRDLRLDAFVLDSSSSSSADARLSYDLYALCVHVGGDGIDSGHYVSYCEVDHETGAWYRFDDEIVTPVNIDYELTTREIRENAYLLFYRRNRT